MGISRVLKELKRELISAVKRVQKKKCAASCLKKQRFALNNISYFRELSSLPTHCPGSQSFTVTHALNCEARLDDKPASSTP